MTLIAVVKTNLPGSIIIAGGSRVTRNSPISGKFEARTDLSQKVIALAQNVITGLAGDYRIVSLFSKLERRLTKVDSFGKPPYEYYEFQLRTLIKDYLVKNFRESWVPTEVFIVIQDLKGKSGRKLFKLVLPEDIFVELDPGLHVIGVDAQTRSEFTERYLKNLNFVLNKSAGDSKSIAIALLETFAQIEHPEIGGSIQCFSMEEKGWVNIGHANSSDGGEHFVATALGDQGFVTQVNGSTVISLTKDYSVINDKLSNEVKS